MSKWAKYSKKYNKEWEKEDGLKEWILSVPGDEKHAACKFCKTTVRAHHADLVNHSKTEKHKKNATPFSNMRTLFQSGISKIKASNAVKASELKLAAHIACHSSIRTVDHLGELVKDISCKDLSLHRTKCTALVNKVLGPSMFSDLRRDIGDSDYSLIIDESTDNTMKKKLCIVVRYPSYEKKRIVTSFAGLVELERGTAEAVTTALLEFLEKHMKLDVKKCIGLGTDGCNTMSGAHNSVISKLREVNPHVTHIKCICHSLQLCTSYAMKKLPSHLEYMLSQTYRYFSSSVLRQQKYANLYSTINVGEQPLKILQLCDTRWLAIAPCLSRILHQYDELKLHFEISKHEDYAADLLYQMYKDPANKAFLAFLNPIVSQVNRVNKMFEADQCNVSKLLAELISLYQSVLIRLMMPRTFSSQQAVINFDVS